MKIKRFLRLNGESSKSFALKLGISNSTMSRILRGSVLPSIAVAKKILKKSYRAITVDDIVDQYHLFYNVPEINIIYNIHKEKGILFFKEMNNYLDKFTPRNK